MAALAGRSVFMFADQVKIYIRSGKGETVTLVSDVNPSFLQEDQNGGDGGKGGDVIVVDEGLNTLSDFRHMKNISTKRRRRR